MMKPLSGSIIYKGHVDVFERMDEFRQNLGLCLQEDRLFPYLSVMNHLLFFGMVGIAQFIFNYLIILLNSKMNYRISKLFNS